MPDYTTYQLDPKQFTQAQNQAYAVLEAICGPEVALAFARYYGKNISPDQIVNTARDFGLWSTQTGMRGPQAQKALLDKLGIPAQFSPEVNQGAIQQAIAQGGIAALSTPFHYFTLQGYNPQTGQYDTGQSGASLKGGSRYLTMADIQRLGQGAPNGQFILTGGNASVSAGSQANVGSAQLDYNNKEQVKQYIRYAAAKRGIDPDVAVKVADSEGLNTYVGDNNSSFGPFQLHYGNVAGGGNAVGGMGDSFTQATGLDARDPRTIKEQIDYSLDAAKTNGWGAWHGAQRVGLSNYQGIGTFNGDPNVYGDFTNLSSAPAANKGGIPSQSPKPVATGLPHLAGGGLSGLGAPPSTGLPNLAGGGTTGLPPMIQMGSQFMTPSGSLPAFTNPTVAPPQVQANTWLS
jgi:hypothetical protein